MRREQNVGEMLHQQVFVLIRVLDAGIRSSDQLCSIVVEQLLDRLDGIFQAPPEFVFVKTQLH